MYETTTPPQKALKHYSQAPWLLICLLFIASPLLGQPCQQPDSTGSSYDQAQQFQGSSAGQEFGGSLAMSGNLKVVGSPQAGSNSQGEAEIFRRNGDTWVSEGLLPAPPLLPGERFGTSVDVYDNENGVRPDLIVVSTNPVNSATGLLIINTYTFCNTGPIGQLWELSSTISNYTDSLVGSSPGSSVAIDGDTLVIGLPFFSWGDGSVAIYTGGCNGWNLGEIYFGDSLTQNNPTGPELHRLGSWVDVDGDQIIVGDPTATVDGEVEAGAAYFITRDLGSGWSICNNSQEPLTAAASSSGVATAGESFGSSVAIAGDVVVIGASNAQGGPGSAYVFRRLGPSPQDKCNLQFEQQLTADNGVDGDAFGRAVAVIADFSDASQPLVGTGRIVVGALLADTAGTNSGSAYVYDYALTGNTPEWTQVVELQPDDPSADDRFGVNVALANCTIGVASHLKDSTATNAGGTTLFLAPECNDCAIVEAISTNIGTAGTCDSTAQITLNNLSGCLMIGAEVSVVYPFGPPDPIPWPFLGPSVSPGTIIFNTPIPSGDDINIDVLISGIESERCVCLKIVLLGTDGNENLQCCTLTVCVRTPAQAGCGDCNDDGVPDAIAIDLDISTDCNNNGIPDECDISSGWSNDCNNNGIPDDCENCFCCLQMRIGDPNGDGVTNIADAIAMLGYLFSGEALNCVAAMDVNGDNLVDISDPIYELSYLFGSGAPPVGGGDCTPDPDPADPPLECESSGCP